MILPHFGINLWEHCLQYPSAPVEAKILSSAKGAGAAYSKLLVVKKILVYNSYSVENVWNMHIEIIDEIDLFIIKPGIDYLKSLMP